MKINGEIQAASFNYRVREWSLPLMYKFGKVYNRVLPRIQTSPPKLWQAAIVSPALRVYFLDSLLLKKKKKKLYYWQIRISKWLPWLLLQLAQFSAASLGLPFLPETELVVLLAGLWWSRTLKKKKKTIIIIYKDYKAASVYKSNEDKACSRVQEQSFSWSVLTAFTKLIMYNLITNLYKINYYPPTCFASMAAVYSRPKLKSVWKTK